MSARLIHRDHLGANGTVRGVKHTYDNGHVYIIWQIRDYGGAVQAFSYAEHDITHSFTYRDLNEIANRHELASHVRYPHEPGSLYDCPRCEAQCFCNDSGECVACAIQAEQDATDRGIDQMREGY